MNHEIARSGCQRRRKEYKGEAFVFDEKGCFELIKKKKVLPQLWPSKDKYVKFSDEENENW